MEYGKREALFRQWADRHRGILVHVARGFADNADRDDLLQDMLLAIWHAIPAFRGDASPSTFIYRVAQNTALTWQRRQRRHPAGEEFDEAAHAAPPFSPKAERTEALYRAIRQLPELDRSLVLLYLDGKPYREMADILGLSESNVGVRLNRLRSRLADDVQETINDCAD